MRHEIQRADAIRISAEVVIAASGVSGLTPQGAVQRLSDGYWLQAGGGSWGPLYAENALSAVDATNMPGLYEYLVPTARLTYAQGAYGYRALVREATRGLLEYIDIQVSRTSAEEGLPLFFTARVGEPVELPLPFDADRFDEIGGELTLTVYSGSLLLADPGADLSLTVAGLDTGTGYALLNATLTRVGTYYIRADFGYTVRTLTVVAAPPEGVVDGSLEGDLTVTTAASATVRVFDAAGTRLVARGVADADGKVTFPLPVGTYQLRFNKDGHSFPENPYEVAVNPNDSQAPRIDVAVPDAALSSGDTLMLLGEFFGAADVRVQFGLSDVVAATVDPRGRALFVTVPSGLASTIVPVRVRKPQGESPDLYSNVVNIQHTPAGP